MQHTATMKALFFDGKLSVRTVTIPPIKSGEIRIRVVKAGICNTDHEIIRGYVPGFCGIPGHEFVGIVDEADDETLKGKRCSAEINCACGSCSYCQKGLGRHCPQRSVIGIIDHDGAFAQYITVPQENVTLIPDTISDSDAVFIEPLAAALEIFQQIHLSLSSRVLLFGDGKLGLLIGFVLGLQGYRTTVVGKHQEKLDLLSSCNTVTTVLLDDFNDAGYDFVIEASGNPSAFSRALECVNPRGTIILKSTYAGGFTFNPSSVVVNEISLIGSRCGVFSDALAFLEKHTIPFDSLISKEFPLDDAVAGFDYSSRTDSLKVLISMSA